ncbi:MAG: DNA-binding protein [Planctomycetes bacterium]|nr:DNA-binding protein [Planctomycetota bacterium]
MQTHALRLTPGRDLRAELESFTRNHNIQAGCILTAVGSLTRANLRYGGNSEGAVTTGDLEIVSLVGTLSSDGPHLHLAVADESGKVTAGHMLEGCTIRTTAEIVIGELEGVAFSRAEDPRTGHRELKIEKVK